MEEFLIGIIGGSGYIGSELAEHFARSFKIKVIDINPPSLQHDVDYGHCDITDYHEVKKALSDVDLVIHTAIVQIPQINKHKLRGYRVNFLGTQNVCRVVNETTSVKGMILAGTWHVFGEEGFEGTIDETFGFRPDKVEKRARPYALSKIAQEVTTRYFDEMSDKIYGVIRMGTALGERMPRKTAARIFISKGLMGESITPFKHSMHRPMLYIDVRDICHAFVAYARKILEGEVASIGNGPVNVFNLCWPKPITIIELARIVMNKIEEVTEGVTKPSIKIVDKREHHLYKPEDKEKIKVDIRKIQSFLGISDLIDPEETIEKIVRTYLQTGTYNK